MRVLLYIRRHGKSSLVLAFGTWITIITYFLWNCNTLEKMDVKPETKGKLQATKAIKYNSETVEGLHQGQEATNKSQLNSKEITKKSPPVFGPIQEHPVNTRLPKIVYYLWCSRNPYFVFANYLSLQSTAKFLQPERILFLYNTMPQVDKHKYNMWLGEFVEEYPYIQMQQLRHNATCSNQKSILEFLYDYLRDGGIVLGTSTILSEPAMHLWNEGYLSHMTDPRNGIIVKAPGPKPKHTHQGIDCVYVPTSQFSESIPSLCLSLSLEMTSKDIWQLDTDIGRLLNFLMYDAEQTPQAKPNSGVVVPNIAHILWLNNKPINYLFYLGALSLIYIVRVDTLYIHGTIEPTRDGYWGELMKEEKVEYIHIETPDRLFDQRTASSHHKSDVFRAQIMDKYGGIYSDVDAIWTQPLDDKLRRYDAVAAFDFAHNYMFYPDYINLGISFGSRGAPFWKYFLQSFKIIKDDLFGFNGLLQPYKIYERHPDTIKIKPNLQVMCFRGDCYPSWTKDWRAIDWRKETYAFHWVYPDPKEFTNRTTLMSSSSMWAEIGQYVLKASGK